MSRLYRDRHRALQDEFDTRKLADRIEDLACSSELDDAATGFIGAQDFFFLATVDDAGQPTVSYKGGFPGFVKVVNPTTLVFPSFNGNGMYLSMGNVAEMSKIGMLFISFERPMRMRLQGTASLLRDGDLLASYKEAELLVRVDVTEVWMNCPRYIHRYERVASSRYVPQEGKETPMAGWKYQEDIQDVIRPDEAARAEAEGLITEEEWIGRILSGDPLA